MCCISSNLRFRQESQCLCFSSCLSRTTESQRGSCGPWGELDGRLAGTSPATPACPFEKTTSVRTSRVWYMELNCCSSSGVDEAIPRMFSIACSLLKQFGVDDKLRMPNDCFFYQFYSSSVVGVEAIPRVFKHGFFLLWNSSMPCISFSFHFRLNFQYLFTCLGHLCLGVWKRENFFCPLRECKHIGPVSKILSKHLPTFLKGDVLFLFRHLSIPRVLPGPGVSRIQPRADKLDVPARRQLRKYRR